MHLWSRKLRLAAAAAAAAVATAAAGCASTPATPSSGKPVRGGTATMAFVTGTQPNYIFPFMSLAYESVGNAADFQELMYRSLSVFNTDGADTLVPNPKYSGSPKPTISALAYKTYTSDTTEYTALKSGQVDIGEIPPVDLAPKPSGSALPATNPLASSGYSLHPFYEFGFDYYLVNWNNPTYGPVFKQLYFRQALEYLDDQHAMDSTIYRGYGYPTTGAVPTLPANQWVPSAEKGNGLYPFNISKAKSLLTSHGWSLVGGVMTCTDPSKCGAGVKKGLALKLTFDYTSGVTVYTDEADVYKSAAAKAGIDLTTAPQAFSTITGEAVPSNHSWEMAMFGGWSYEPDYEPTGEILFATGAGTNGGAYSNPTMNKLITETQTSSSLSVFHNYATYAAEQLPFIYMPNSYEVMAVKSTLHAVAFNPLYWTFPEYWYFTK
jgi:peptide/nickel transport system substrate-binding protein